MMKRLSDATYRTSFCLAIHLLCILPEVCFAQKPVEVEEYQAKSALIYNFAKFVTWPEDTFKESSSPFVFAVLGENPFGDALGIIAGKSIHGRQVEIRHCEEIRQLIPCQILFCSVSDLKNIFKKRPKFIAENHTLTVGDKDGFANEGGMLSLIFVDEHLGFNINDAAARDAGISISSNLLKLATVVISKTNE